MNFIDVRFPMGLLFVGLGLLLAIAGLADPDPTTSLNRKVGTNANLLWGLLMLAFGVVNVLLAWRKSRSTAGQSDNTTEPPTEQ
jgi:hypothetical protein